MSERAYGFVGDWVDEGTERDADLKRMAAEAGMRPQDLDVCIRAGVDLEKLPKNEYGKRLMIRYLRKQQVPPPKWMVISGLFPESEAAYSAKERRVRVRAVYKAAVLLIRRELKLHEVDADRLERSVYWEPVSEVCRDLEISASKLSGFCRELTGNNLSQVIDGVRAEGLAKKLKAGVEGFGRG